MINKLLESKPAKLVFFLMNDFEETDFPGTCTQMAFFLLLSFFPLLVFLISFVGRFIETFEDYLFDILRTFLPELSYQYVTNLLESMTQYHNNSKYFLILLSLFFATFAVRAIMVGLNQTYAQQEARSHLKIWGLSFLFTILLAIAVLFVLVAYFISVDLGEFILTSLGLSEYQASLIQMGAIFFSWTIAILLLNFIFTKAPSQSLRFKSGFPGSIFAFLGLNIAFRIFTLFINHSSRYSSLYGNLGGLFALLVALYFISIIINLGGKVNLYWSFYRKKELKSLIWGKQ
ncbi:MAG: rane protein [Eubacteriaceae bacterium]|jgi:membrane protein|nr:rane protein [Eubacteriaceae bacterium]MDK2905894.1 rane protein [Eubacteriaceae bacterium]MDK2936503.1 rane protein [Eubacteriaceae bacterium]MDK2962549.1 rane protein [Eubacteriaceae bacterium]MDN5307739.1 rane protein [Eubacteriaceae bacterium]